MEKFVIEIYKKINKKNVYYIRVFIRRNDKKISKYDLFREPFW